MRSCDRLTKAVFSPLLVRELVEDGVLLKAEALLAKTVVLSLRAVEGFMKEADGESGVE